ncbi:hypothetical protein EV356DRAFT_470512, partial [Viridothelium virens]
MASPGEPEQPIKADQAPDVMNDPAYATNAPKDEKSSEDPDTCRICRGEGTDDEPLFYPCKCSGSIKFVHQDCLMEWLSHSHKKHCELCKTPFRFTKLYHPQMPETIPTTIFLHRAAIHCVRQFLTWCRGLLVVSVWLLWLPWCMRFVWRGLFWIGDGGWARDLTAIAHLDSTGPRGLTAAEVTNSSTGRMPSYLSSSISLALNLSRVEPIGFSFLKRFVLEPGGLAPASSDINGTNTTSFYASGDRLTAQMQHSLLSGIPFFSAITPSPALNRLILDVLEGQIITLFVLIAFILIFLIREWVVQQQPVINMAALNAQNARRGPQQPVAGGEDPREQGDGRRGLALPVPPHIPPMNEEIIFGTGQEHDTAAGSPTAGSSTSSSRSGDVEDAEDAEDRPSERQARSVSGLNTSETGDQQAGGESSQDFSDVLWKDLEVTTSLPPEFLRAVRESRMDDARAIFDRLTPEDRTEALRQVQEKHSLWTPEKINAEFKSWESKRSESTHFREGSRSRPQMPSRDQSFMATAVMRGIEEVGGSRSSGKALEEASKKDDSLSEDTSEESSESWQHLSSSENEKNAASATQKHPLEKEYQSSLLPSPNLKGKNKIVDTSDETEGTVVPSDPGQSNANEGVDADATDDNEETEDSPTTNPFHPEFQGELPNADENVAQAGNAIEGNTWLDQLLDWLWGDAAPAEPAAQAPAQDDEELLDEGNNDEPENFVHVVDGQPAPHVHAAHAQGNIEDGGQDPEVLAAAQQAGVDPDPAAVEDAEDLEGIMELIGMQGPLTGLVQNAMFGAFLISATVAGAVWFPYLWGKLVIMFIGSPISLLFRLPVAIVSGVTDFVADTCLFFGGSVLHWGMKATRILFLALGWIIPVFNSDYQVFNSIAAYGSSVGEHALDRIAILFLSAGLSFDADYLHLSLKSHAALRSIQGELRGILSLLLTAVVAFCRSLADVGVVETFRQGWLHTPEVCLYLANEGAAWVREGIHSILDLFLSMKTMTPNGSEELAVVHEPIDTSLAYWSATDRLLAVLAGYGFFALAGALYLKRNRYFTTSQQGRKIEGMITEILQQAGGVMKVIFIISIEMIVFPLYCGILLDVALLPLCEDATVLSRVDWTLGSPWTSGFVHWFIGTCYMFHFALFVSMCRKIMRNGVLYFIRDPDDPTFHPVRDVLERNVSTQLRKITFSALVYGGLVIVCLGGVVWSLTYAFDSILPIRWSANEPFFEFPTDLLLYNFLVPALLKTLQPSQVLHTMYEWWFRHCARMLRLSHFLFGEQHEDEEGRSSRLSWASFFFHRKESVATPTASENGKENTDEPPTDVDFVRNGRYVRAPASDQVRIPKGRDVFLEVDENNKRLDGLPEDGEGIHGRENDQFQKVYIPPWFRFRIGLFIGCLWIFAAVTGIGLTIVPLLFGRKVFSVCLDDATRINDIYAFCFGLYSLGGVGYSLVKARTGLNAIKKHLRESNAISSETLQKIKSYGLRTAKVVYTYSAFALLVPCIFALVLELYFILPLHSYVQLIPTLLAPHVLHILQSWTLGLLYFRLTLRILLALPTARAGRALRAVIRRGWWDPDVALATRGFILPLLIIAIIIVAGPPAAAGACVRAWTWFERWEDAMALLYRFSYPVALAACMGTWGALGLIRALGRWRRRIRDEVYLVGERLHNFGETRAAGVGANGRRGSGQDSETST